jgi:hypothetical protein
VLSKYKPLSVTKTLPGHPKPSSVKGRIITLEFEGCYIVATYVVNAGTGLKVTCLILSYQILWSLTSDPSPDAGREKRMERSFSEIPPRSGYD